ncbi:MAG: ABC transporter permease, partial [Bryobacteraceae bacterium]
GEPERLVGARVTAGLLPTLGIAPLRGRLFTAADDQPNTARVALLGEGFWRRRFGADEAILGRSVELDGQPYTVAGVLPRSARTPRFQPDVWIPLAMVSRPNARRSDFLAVVARLKPGISIAQAQADMTRLSATLAERYPADNKGWSARVVLLHEEFSGALRTPLRILFGAVALVLLIACANAAGLQLARSTAREREVAIRLALGAGRGRLVRQFLAETVALSAIGGAAGLLLATWGLAALQAAGRSFLPQFEATTLDPGVLAFTLALSIGTGILFGLAPALAASKTELHDSLKEGGRGFAGRAAGRRLRSGLVVAQVALAFVLVIGAGLLIRSLGRLLRADPGFRLSSFTTAAVQLPAARYSSPAARAAFTAQLVDRL